MLALLIALLLPSTYAAYVDLELHFHFNNSSCIANDTLIEVKDVGNVAAAMVRPGDRVRGVMGANMTRVWCTVIANPDHGYGRVVGSFTPGHMVARESEGLGRQVTVAPHLAAGVGRMAGLRNIATDCELTETADGQLFAPFSDTFCDKELSWSDYLALMSSVLELTRDVPFVWDVSSWRDNASHPFFPSLHRLCADIIECTQNAADSASCAHFAATVDALVDSNLESSRQETFRTTWPSAAAMVDAMHLRSGRVAGLSLSITLCTALLGSALVLVGTCFIVKLRRLRRRVKETVPEVERAKAVVQAV